jgi:hypothetical protein
MKTRAIASLAGLGGVLIMSNTSSAAYQGLTVRLHTTAPVNGINRDVWRVYAMFSDPGDFLVSVAGSPTLGKLVLQSLDVFGNPGGGNFVNPAGGGATAPSFNQVGTQVEWDTLVTIGRMLRMASKTSRGFLPGLAESAPCPASIPTTLPGSFRVCRHRAWPPMAWPTSTARTIGES